MNRSILPCDFKDSSYQDGPSCSPILRWSVATSHAKCERIEVCLSVSLAGARGSTSTPECRVELWAFVDLEEVAYCRGQLIFSERASSHIIWLGRSSNRSVHPSVRGHRCVVAPPSASLPKGHSGWLTIAEVMLGLTAAIFEIFDSTEIELEVMDDGSGGLGRYYANLGFRRFYKEDFTSGKIKNSWMSSEVTTISQLAPPQWLSILVPRNFDAPHWLRTNIKHFWIERARRGRLPRWSWPVSFPARADLEIKVDKCLDPELGSCVMLEASVESAGTYIPVEMAYCRCVIQLQRQVLAVHWLGRHNDQPVSSSIRGHRRYVTSCTNHEHGHEVPFESEVTCAMALLGVLAMVASWFGIATATLIAPSSGSNRLVQYLRGIGFVDQVEPGEEPRIATRNQVRLQMPCEMLAQHCCPVEWRGKLFESEDLNRISHMSLNKSFDVMPPIRHERYVGTSKQPHGKPHVLQAATSDATVRKLPRCASEGSITKPTGLESGRWHRHSKICLEPL